MVFKNTYILDFLGLTGYFSEKDLENAIISQLENFILELGQGFAFLERQKRISIDSTDYYLDLLFYHRKLNCLVAIDLKLGKFKTRTQRSDGAVFEVLAEIRPPTTREFTYRIITL